MKPDSKPAARMTPLLRAIATELVERTLRIVTLESALRGDPANVEIVAALANHRRELRRVEKELRGLGWSRDEEQPLRFRRLGSGEHWEPEDTAFYRSVDVYWPR